MARPSRVAVDEKQIDVDGDKNGCNQRLIRRRTYC